ncbi:MAG: hypothetical protein L6R28_25330 [Planctomycetes bacterium]|nr:hypothetical protein [Planctomycetota bacterium]
MRQTDRERVAKSQAAAAEARAHHRIAGVGAVGEPVEAVAVLGVVDAANFFPGRAAVAAQLHSQVFHAAVRDGELDEVILAGNEDFAARGRNEGDRTALAVSIALRKDYGRTQEQDRAQRNPDPWWTAFRGASRCRHDCLLTTRS